MTTSSTLATATFLPLYQVLARLPTDKSCDAGFWRDVGRVLRPFPSTFTVSSLKAGASCQTISLVIEYESVEEKTSKDKRHVGARCIGKRPRSISPVAVKLLNISTSMGFTYAAHLHPISTSYRQISQMLIKLYIRTSIEYLDTKRKARKKRPLSLSKAYLYAY